MSSSARRNDSLVWTDDEVELLLRVTLEYKTTRYEENVDWETCQNKYQDIAVAFRQQYTTGDAAAAGKDFPHEPSTITKTQITAKLKAVRNKYRHAVDSGRLSSHGVLIFYELCHEIWGGSPAVTPIPSGFESGDLVEETEETTEDSDAEIVRRRNLLQDKLINHRTGRLKRKAPAEAIAEEDIKIMRRMLELMESSEMHVRETEERLNANIDRLSHTLEAGFDMVKTLLQQQQVLAPHTYALLAHHAPHLTTPAPYLTTPAPHAPHLTTPRPDACTPSHATPNYTPAHAATSMPSYTPSHTTSDINPIVTRTV
ncbi:uncharacterized protein PAE49_005816 [Odontesthes bonariensis]|uniref:uncharacterized protein LOC142380653 n=1 Tax=Odontesthes bonariensis TaxID=219752 RepID=UPI003F587BB7